MSLPPSQPHCGPNHILGLFSQAKYLTKKTQAASVEAVKMLDEILLQLSVSSLGAGGVVGVQRVKLLFDGEGKVG